MSDVTQILNAIARGDVEVTLVDLRFAAGLGIAATPRALAQVGERGQYNAREIARGRSRARSPGKSRRNLMIRRQPVL